MGIQLREPKTQKLILLGILGAALLYVHFMTSLHPFTYRAGAAQLAGLTQEYGTISRDLTKARQAVNSLPYLEREHTLLQEKWSMAQRLLPDEEETASLLRALTLLGDQAGVDFVLFKPMSPHPAQYYTEHPIEVKVQGGYHEVGTFLGEVANMERIVTVSDLAMETAKEIEEGKTATASFVAMTYTLGGTGVPPEEDEPGAMKNVKKAKGRAKEIGDKLRSKQRGETDHE